MASIPRARVAALGLLALVVGAFYFAAVVPYLELLGHYDRQVRQLESRLAVYGQAMRDGEAAAVQLRELTRYEAAQRYYLPSDSAALSSAALQRHVKEAIERNGGTLVSSQVLNERSDGPSPGVVLRISMRLGPEALEKVLYALEYERPLLFVDNLYIASRPTISARRNPANLPRQLIDVRFEVTGYRRQSRDA